MNDEEKSRLNRLEERLYSRKHNENSPDERKELSKQEFDVKNTWESKEDPLNELLARQREISLQKGNPFKKILWGSISFFVIALVVAGYMFFVGENTVSVNKIDISVLGPATISAGEELSLEVIIKNENNTDLEGANLLIEYPAGSRVAGSLEEELTRQREVIGRIAAGGEGRRTIKSVLFGEKESIQSIKMTLEYRIKGSNAIFFKDKQYELAIKSSPIIFTVDGPKEINAGQDIDFDITLTSNTSEMLRNLLVKAEYPFGFSFLESKPASADQDNLWDIGDLPPGEKRTIFIKGSIQGQNEEERTFRFYAGIASEKNEQEIGAQIVSLTHSVSIKRPFIDLVLSINNDSSPEYIAELGEKIQMNVIWTNNLPSKLLNGKIEVKLSGVALDRSSVSPKNGGFFRSSDNTIVWDKNNNPDLAEISPGGRGVVGFSFSPLTSISGAQNQDINILSTMSGSQVLPSGPPQNVVSSSEKLIKLASSLNLSSRLVYYVGPLENRGPMPPVAEQETTYTVIWNITNTLNDASNVSVRATLPSYVGWADFATPSQENITFDSLSREVVWNVGEVRAGTGFLSSSKEAAFQVVFTPSLSQVGSSPIVVSDSRMTGQDKYTSKPLSSTKPAMTTRLTTDPNFKSGDETVVK